MNTDFDLSRITNSDSDLESEQAILAVTLDNADLYPAVLALLRDFPPRTWAYHHPTDEYWLAYDQNLPVRAEVLRRRLIRYGLKQ